MSISHLSLFKRSNGVYYIIYVHDGRTRWKSTHATLKHEALKVLTEFEQLLKKNPPPMLFTEFVCQFNTSQRYSLRQSTLERIYQPAFDSFLAVCGNKALGAYTVQDVEQFKRTRLEKCSATYVNIQFRSLRAAFNLAVKWQMLNESPFAKATTVKVPEQVPSFLSKRDFGLLLDAVREPVLKDLFLFAVLTGMRQGEILSLQWSDVDLDRKLINVTNSGRFLTKTGKSRNIPMSDTVFGLLSHRSLLKSTSPYIFHRTGFKLNQSYVEHKFKAYIRGLKLNDALRFHSLRHSFSTWLLQDGVNIYEVQKLLGHSSVKVTEVYSHLVASELHSAVNRISLPLN